MNKLPPILYLSILIFLIAFNFQDHTPSGWEQQFFPFMNNRSLADITFLDSLTGYAVTGDGMGGNDTNYILKTTDAGFNWTILVSKIYDFRRIIFLNQDTGYALHGDEILRTTDAGLGWNRIPVPPDNFGFSDMFPISYDTMWVCFAYIGGNYIYKTTNAGYTWLFQVQRAGIEKLYFYNNNIGFACATGINAFLRTTNSGTNWFQIPGETGFGGICFLDNLIGWKGNGAEVKKTTDGGLTWELHTLPTGERLTNYMVNMSIINKDTILGVGGFYTYPGSGITNRAVIYRTTNGGTNWAYQIPDTSFRIARFQFIKFINKNTGWCYAFQSLPDYANGIHTTIGGDTNFISNIYEPIKYSPQNYILYQNYPNPFNPVTHLEFGIPDLGFVSLKVYDVLGKEVKTIFNENKPAGNYEVIFDGSDLSSGIYFYSLSVDGNVVDTKRMVLLK